MQTLAAVDIGSNAIRIHIAYVLTNESSYEFKTLEYIRVPLRLGEDVFTSGTLSNEKIDKLTKLGTSLVHLFELFSVDKYLCCATSAMREAQNRAEVISSVEKASGFRIEIIDGDKEAELTNYGLKQFIGTGTWVHVDVGGGSTEINIYHEKVKTCSRSFRVGAVRMLMEEDISEEWDMLENWIKNNLPSGKNVVSIGTGGNIGKLHQMAKLSDTEPVTLSQINALTSMIDSYSREDRIRILKLNPDRADVIIPSSKIYLAVMQAAGATVMYCPKIGLTDGMLEILKEQAERR